MPSYLFAIASGDIATASIGPRSVVSTGPEELSAAKWEVRFLCQVSYLKRLTDFTIARG